jgi:hypothetical protein
MESPQTPACVAAAVHVVPLLCELRQRHDFAIECCTVCACAALALPNTDLTVYLQRQPQGEWVCLDASTDADPHGVGVAHSRLHNEQGQIGRSLQALFIDRV